jgi:hypothetical protein
MPFPAVLSPRRAFGALAVALVLAAGLSACGSSASTSSTAAAAASGGVATSSSAQFQARLNLAKCFRAHGINVPDPTSGGGPAGGGGIFRSLRNYPQAQVTTATQACRTYFSQAFTRPNLTPAQRQQQQQQLVKFAQCLRSHGVNVPDPTANGAGGGFGFARQFGSVARNSPAFQAATKACASVRPQFGRGGGGGPGAGGAPPAGGTSGA